MHCRDGCHGKTQQGYFESVQEHRTHCDKAGLVLEFPKYLLIG